MRRRRRTNSDIPMKPSARFERQIERIHELLERSGAVVTWNDRVPDPDNPRQQRQVDITIRRGRHLTLIECRLRRDRQGVMWIEELIGRRRSLGADAVIAVSSSGFTPGAIAKGLVYDVATRDLLELTDEQIRSWGRSVALTLFFYQYSDVKVSVLFERESLSRIEPVQLQSELAAFTGFQALLESGVELIKAELRPSSECVGRSAQFGLRGILEGLLLGGEPVAEVICEGRVHLVARSIEAPVIRAYGSPGQGSKDREATVQQFALGETSVVHEGKRISVLLDVSRIEIPPLCQFRFFEVSGQEEMDYEVVDVVGVDNLRKPWVQGGAIRVEAIGV